MKTQDQSARITQLFKQAQQAYIANQQMHNVDQLLNYMISKGTLKDKLSALLKQITQHPSWSLKYIEQLSRSTKSTKGKECLQACSILGQLFMQFILKDKSALKYFRQNIESSQAKTKKKKNIKLFLPQQLRDFYLQHRIKSIYSIFIRTLDQLLKDNIYHTKKTALDILIDLSQFDEMRSTILQSLVNKFGDGDLQLVNELTKNLKTKISFNYSLITPLLKQVQSFLFRKNISNHGQFYCINFLSNLNMKLMHESNLTQMLELYFKLFKKLVINQNQVILQQDMNSKLFLNIVKGLNRIFPVVKGQFKQFNQVFQEKVDYIYKIIHTTQNTKIKIQLFLFLYQSQNHIYKTLPDRYYRCLYQFLTDQSLIQTSLLQLFFDLLLISIKQDQKVQRISAFVRRLLQTSLNASPAFIITTLIFVSKVMQTHNCIYTMIHKPEGFLNEEDEQINAEQNKNINKQYDIFKRQPLHAHAQDSCLWQLTVLKNHFHPTVRKFTQILLDANNNQVSYPGNPLLDFSLSNFIEKVCLKSQKKSQGWRLKNLRNLSRIRNSKYQTLINKPLEDLQQDQKFLKNYLSKKKQLNSLKKRPNQQQLQDFADQVIQKQMDRLNGKQDQQDEQELQNLEYQEDFEDQQDLGQQNQFDQNLDQQGFQEDMQEQDMGLKEGQEQGQDDLNQDQQNGDYEDDYDSEQQQMDEEQSQQKDFGDVFQQIGIDKMSKHKRDKKIIGKNKSNKTKHIKKSGKNIKKVPQKRNKNVSQQQSKNIKKVKKMDKNNRRY